MWAYVVALGLAMALQPLPVLAVVLLLATERGLAKAWAFFSGEALVMFAIAAATVATHAATSRSSAATAAAWVTLAAGLLLMGVGARWGLQLRGGATPQPPKWMAAIDRMQPLPAFLLGLFIPAYAIAISLGAHIVGAHPTTAQAVAGVVVFCAIGMSTVVTPILLAQFAPERSGPARVALRGWLEANWRAIAVVLLLGVGALLVSKGLVELL